MAVHTSCPNSKAARKFGVKNAMPRTATMAPCTRSISVIMLGMACMA